MDDHSEFVPNVTFELIPIKNLVSNQDYQRHLSMKHVHKAVENFDVYQINPVKVSRRDNVNYVFNGQHTIEIIAMVSGSRDTPVWCMIYSDLEYTHEADIFANQMKYVKRLLPYEIFVANIEAGSDKQLIIKELVESYDLVITGTMIPNGICAVATLETIYDRYGYDVLNRVLRLCVGTWEGAPLSLAANMLNGVARIIAVYGDKLKDDRFKEKLSRVSLKELVRSAKERRSGSLGFSEAILVEYNRKSHSPLPLQGLFSHRAPKAMEPEEEPDEKQEEPLSPETQAGDFELEGAFEDEDGQMSFPGAFKPVKQRMEGPDFVL